MVALKCKEGSTLPQKRPPEMSGKLFHFSCPQTRVCLELHLFSTQNGHVLEPPPNKLYCLQSRACGTYRHIEDPVASLAVTQEELKLDPSGDPPFVCCILPKQKSGFVLNISLFRRGGGVRGRGKNSFK